jgi:Domain of unknown function (DUF3859)
MKFIQAIVVCVVLLNGCSKKAGTPQVTVLRSGLCTQGQEVRKYELENSTAGYGTMGDMTITQEGTTISLKKGVGFGFLWSVTGFPQSFEVIYRYEHPPVTRPDGKTLSGYEEPLRHDTLNGSMETTDCYFLSEDHELVPGQWSIAVVYEGKTVAKQDYQIVR